MPSSNPKCRIQAVVVLYEMVPNESKALCSLLDVLKAEPPIAERFSVVIYDNSAQRQPVAETVSIQYVHDSKNGGLVAAYNYALDRAEEKGYSWLLLLDQDTTLTSEFLSELITCIDQLDGGDKVAAIVPKLMVRGKILSPAEHFIDFIRHQFRNHVLTLDRDVVGVQQDRISAYNSGSTLSVPMLRSIGGFPAQFWLDYLDHAVFHALYAAGGRVYVLGSILQHDLAESDLDARPLWRFQNALKAQSLFVKSAGNFGDQLLYRLWLLRSARRLRKDCEDKRLWKETARQAFLFDLPKASDALPAPGNKYTAE